MTRTTVALLTAAIVVASMVRLAAHNTFIVPEKFVVKDGEAISVGFHSADGFPASSRVLKTLEEPFIHTAAGRVPIADVRAEANRLVARVTVAGSGHVIVSATNRTQTTEMKAGEFTEYLEEEGLTDIIDARKQRGEASANAKERYTMYAKALLLSGAPDDGYSRPVGTPIEIVPMVDPYRLKAGE